MATSLRRSKTMPADGQTAKFLYTILKQLDLKSIDWNLVASQLEISNGHAARMRFSRFKQHMEGTSTNPRNPRLKKSANNKSGKGDTKTGSDKRAATSDISLKEERHDPPFSTNNPFIKSEPGAEPELSVISPAMASIAPGTGPTPGQTISSLGMSYPLMTVAPSDLTIQRPAPAPAPAPAPIFHAPAFEPQRQHVWAPVKLEQHDDGSLGDIFVKVEPQGD